MFSRCFLIFLTCTLIACTVEKTHYGVSENAWKQLTPKQKALIKKQYA